jgi:hypothetical protein
MNARRMPLMFKFMLMHTHAHVRLYTSRDR